MSSTFLVSGAGCFEVVRLRVDGEAGDTGVCISLSIRLFKKTSRDTFHEALQR